MLFCPSLDLEYKDNNVFFLRTKKVKDVDESIWEDKGDGTVVRKQPTAGRSQWSTIRKYSMNHEESGLPSELVPYIYFIK